MKKLFLMLCLIISMIVMTACTEEKQESKQTKPELTDGSSPENESAAASEQEDDEQPAGSHGFLWEVKNGNNTVYLLGSVHVAQKDMYPLRQEIMTAFENSHYLVVEADISSVNAAEVQLFMREKGTYTDGTFLSDHISQELYTELDQLLQTYRLRADRFNQFKPWYITMILENMKVLELQYDSTLGIDYYFLTNKPDEMEILELEGVMEQLQMFHDFSEPIQIEYLKSTIENMDRAEEDLKEIMTIWKSGDLVRLEALVLDAADQSEASKAFNQILLDDRNVNMVEKIDSYLNSQNGKTYFVVVGAAHYIGEMGIVTLLERKGYQVERR